MKSQFIYLTKKRALILFIILQVLPLYQITSQSAPLLKIAMFLGYELVIVGLIAIWQLKPIEQFDEREKSVILKWKGRIIDHGSVTLLIPLSILSLYPEMQAWTLYSLAAIPMFIVYVCYHLLMKKELGQYFAESL